MISSGKGRRDFLRRMGGGLLSLAKPDAPAEKFENPILNPAGYSVISWPDQDFDSALAAISALGFRGVHLRGWAQKLYGQEPEKLRARLTALNLEPVALSCPGVKLDPARETDESGTFKESAQFMTALGGRFLQISDHGRAGRRYGDAEIASLGWRMNELGILAEEMGLELGYHPHFGSFGETRAGIDAILSATSPQYVKLVVDTAHLTLGGSDPAEVVRTHHDRVLYFHFKDLRKDVFAIANKNLELARHSNYLFCPVGRGAVDFPGIIRAMRDLSLQNWVLGELDEYEPLPGGPESGARINRDEMNRLGFDLRGKAESEKSGN